MRFKTPDYSWTDLSENDLRMMRIHDATHFSIESHKKLYPLFLAVIPLFKLMIPILEKFNKKLLDSQVRALSSKLQHTHQK